MFPAERQDGSWTQLVPSYTRTEVTLTLPAPADPLWIDLLAGMTLKKRVRLDVTLRLEPRDAALAR